MWLLVSTSPPSCSVSLSECTRRCFPFFHLSPAFRPPSIPRMDEYPLSVRADLFGYEYHSSADLFSPSLPSPWCSSELPYSVLGNQSVAPQRDWFRPPPLTVSPVSLPLASLRHTATSQSPSLSPGPLAHLLPCGQREHPSFSQGVLRDPRGCVALWPSREASHSLSLLPPLFSPGRCNRTFAPPLLPLSLRTLLLSCLSTLTQWFVAVPCRPGGAVLGSLKLTKQHSSPTERTRSSLLPPTVPSEHERTHPSVPQTPRGPRRPPPPHAATTHFPSDTRR